MYHKEKGYLFSGIIDPVSIIGGLFLVAMLVVGTFVAKNKNFSFNINEKASCMTTCMNQVGDQAECNFTCKESTKVTDKVTAPAPKPKAETTKLCGYCKSTTTCVSCSNGGENVGECGSNNDCNKSNVAVPEPTQQSLTTTPIDNSLEAEEVKKIQDVITAPVVINGTVVNPATSVHVTENNQNNEVSNITGSLTASDVQEMVCKSANGVWDGTTCDYNSNVSTSSTCGKGCPSGQSCVLIGMGYYGCQNTDTLTNYTEDETCANRCATNQQCVVNNVVNGKKEYVCKTVEVEKYVPNTSSQSNVNVFENIVSGSGGVATNTHNPCPDGSKWINKTCVTNQQNITNVENQIAAINQTPSTSVVTTSVQDLINSLTDRFNNVNQSTGITDIGTYGLGGGNAYVAPVPQSVITSTDPNAFSNYRQGSGYSFGAGVLTAGTLPIASSIYSVGLPTTALMGMNAISAATPAISALTVTGLTIGALDCQFGGGYLCETAANTLFSGYALSPEGTMQMFQQAGQVYQDTYAILSSIQRIPKTPTMPLLDGSEAPIQLNDITVNTNGVIIDGSFIDDGVSIANTLASANETASLAIVQNQIPQLTSGAIVQQPNLALLTNVFLNNSQLPVALNVANLNANAIGGGTSNVFNSISPANPTQVSGGQPSATNLTQSPVNLQANQGSNRGSINQKAPMYYGLEEDPTLPVAQTDWGLVGPNKKPLVMHNGQLWDPDELAKFLKSLEGLSVNPNVTNTWRDRMPPIEDAFQLGKLGYNAKEIAAMQTSTTPQSRLAKILDELDINISFPGVTVRRWWDRLTGNVTTTEINPLPEIILDPLPDTAVIIDKEADNPIWAIAPDAGSSIIPAQNLVQNGFTPTIYYAKIAPRVVSGQLSTNPQVARDLADAITKGLKCGFNEQTILCNTAGLFVKDALALIPDYLKIDLKVLTTFDTIARIFEGSPKRPLLIGTGPTTLAVLDMNLGVDTVATLGRPDLVEKFQELIWMIKANQGSDVSAAPEAIKDDLYDYDKLIELQDNLLSEIKKLGYSKNDIIIPACTELEELCKAGSDLTFISPFSLIKPPTEQTIIEKVQEQISSIIKEFILPPDSNALQSTSSVPETGGGKFEIKIPEWIGGSPAGDPDLDPSSAKKITGARSNILSRIANPDPEAEKIAQDAANKIMNAEGKLLDEFVNTYNRPPNKAERAQISLRAKMIGGSGQGLLEFTSVLGAGAAIPVGLYYADQYLFDGYLTDKVTDIYNSAIDYLFGTNKESNSLSKKLIIDYLKIPEQQGSNNPMEYYEDPINTNAKNEDSTPPEGLTINTVNVNRECIRIDKSNPCDGNRIYQTYLEYQKQFGELSPAEFLAIILMAEANGADPEFLKSIALATSSQLWGTSDQHEAYCKTSECLEGIFNFIGAYMEAGARRYNTILYEKDSEKIQELIKADQAAIEYFSKNGISIAQIANDTIYDPISTTYSNDTPTQWGNFGCGESCDSLGPNWIKEANQIDIQTGTTNVCGIYDLAGQDNSIAAVFTENQKYNWSIKNPECFPK